MALTLGDNFSYQGAKPLDARLKYDTLAAMKAVADSTMYDGCLAYCTATDKTYQWKSTNTVDTDTGKWREFTSGGGGSTYTAGGGIDITNDVISTDNLQSGDMDDIITPLPSPNPYELDDLSDVDLGTLSNGDVLKYNSTSQKWENGQGGGGGGGGETTKVITAAIEVGGIDSGTSYPIGTPIENILSDMLEPTLYPTLTAPSASLTYGASTYYAVGSSVSAMSATVALNRGSINPAYGTSGYRSGAATGYSIATSGADTEFSDSNASGTFSVSALTRSTKGNIVVTGTASYAAGEQPKDSKGGDYSTPLAAGSVTASKTLQFILPYYYGASNTSSVSSFTGLSSSVTAKGQKTFNYTTNNQYMVFAYDSSYGNLKTILDGNGFDVTGGWTKSTVTVGGFSYFVYVSNSPTTDTNAPFTFKY